MYKSYKEALCGNIQKSSESDQIQTTTMAAMDDTQVGNNSAVDSQELVVKEEVMKKWEKEQLDMEKQVLIADVDDWARRRVSPDNAAQHPGGATEMEAKPRVIIYILLRPEQLEMEKQVIIADVDDWARRRVTPDNAAQHPGVRPLRYIAGVDISFIKGDNVNACAAYVVLEYPELEVVYEDLSMVALDTPYIPGYLAFREAKFLVEKIEKQRAVKPELTPQVIMSDGNGILHPRKFGLACHLGVQTGIPQLGAAKNLFAVRGISKDKVMDTQIRRLRKGGDAFPLIDEQGETLGAALKAHDDARNPVYVSPGHKLSVETAVWVAHLCTRYRVPEPTRQADIRSREYLRKHFPTERQRQPSKQQGLRKRGEGRGLKRGEGEEGGDIDAT